MKAIFASALIFMLNVTTVWAQPTVGDGPTVSNPGSGTSIVNPLKVSSITDLFKLILDVLLVFAVPIIAFFIIYAGFLYVTARGNTEQVTKAHRALLYALIGGVIILGASVLIDVIQNTVNQVKNK